MESTRIVRMSGELENQLYQYAFLRYIELATQEKCLVDNSDFCQGVYDYELERVFGIKLTFLSDCFSEDVWSEMLQQKMRGYSIPQQLLDNGLELMMFAESDDSVFDGKVVRFESRSMSKENLGMFIKTSGDVYYDGYFINPAFFSSNIGILRKELVFPEIRSTLDIDTINEQYEILMSVTNSVSVYVGKSELEDRTKKASFAHYAKALKALEKGRDDFTYFVFSDDMKWCKGHEKELGLRDVLGDVIYVEENLALGKRYVDMNLMGLCEKMMISYDAFGLLAFFLHRRPDLELFNVVKR